MAIRDKLRAKFAKNKSSSGESTPATKQSSIPGHYTGRTDIEYYKPHEIPKSKYRGRVDKAHQDTLESYSFGDAFLTVKRKTSTAFSGTFSPGGTQAFSRRTSYNSAAGAQTPGRCSSISSATGDSFSVPSSGSDSTHLSFPSGPSSGEPILRERSNEDAEEIDLSRTATAVNVPSVRLDRQATVTEKNAINEQSNNHAHIEHSRSSNDVPFSADELTRALTQATITSH